MSIIQWISRQLWDCVEGMCYTIVTTVLVGDKVSKVGISDHGRTECVLSCSLAWLSSLIEGSMNVPEHPGNLVV